MQARVGAGMVGAAGAGPEGMEVGEGTMPIPPLDCSALISRVSDCCCCYSCCICSCCSECFFKDKRICAVSIFSICWCTPELLPSPWVTYCNVFPSLLLFVFVVCPYLSGIARFLVETICWLIYVKKEQESIRKNHEWKSTKRQQGDAYRLKLILRTWKYQLDG